MIMMMMLVGFDEVGEISQKSAPSVCGAGASTWLSLRNGGKLKQIQNKALSVSSYQKRPLLSNLEVNFKKSNSFNVGGGDRPNASWVGNSEAHLQLRPQALGNQISLAGSRSGSPCIVAASVEQNQNEFNTMGTVSTLPPSFDSQPLDSIIRDYRTVQKKFVAVLDRLKIDGSLLGISNFNDDHKFSDLVISIENARVVGGKKVETSVGKLVPGEILSGLDLGSEGDEGLAEDDFNELVDLGVCEGQFEGGNLSEYADVESEEEEIESESCLHGLEAKKVVDGLSTWEFGESSRIDESIEMASGAAAKRGLWLQSRKATNSNSFSNASERGSSSGGLGSSDTSVNVN